MYKANTDELRELLEELNSNPTNELLVRAVTILLEKHLDQVMDDVEWVNETLKGLRKS